MAGAREENEERSTQREKWGTPEDVEEHREKMWEDKATDADCRNVTELRCMQRGMELFTSAPVDVCSSEKMPKRRWEHRAKGRLCRLQVRKALSDINRQT